MSQQPLLLAVDCATRTASVAVTRGEEVLSARSTRSDQHHAQALLREIDAALEEAGVGLAAVDAFAVSIGPGAFTSLRIGLSTVKGLVFGTDKPVAAVSTLAAIAHAAGPESPRVAAVLDARRGEVYAGQFDRTGGFPRLVGEEGVYSCAELVEALPPGIPLVGEVPGSLLEALEQRGRSDAGAAWREPAITPRALAVASLGAHALAAGPGVPASELAPRYLRRAEAEEKRLAAAGSLDTAKKP